MSVPYFVSRQCFYICGLQQYLFLVLVSCCPNDCLLCMVCFLCVPFPFIYLDLRNSAQSFPHIPTLVRPRPTRPQSNHLPQTTRALKCKMFICLQTKVNRDSNNENRYNNYIFIERWGDIPMKSLLHPQYCIRGPNQFGIPYVIWKVQERST